MKAAQFNIRLGAGVEIDLGKYKEDLLSQFGSLRDDLLDVLKSLPQGTAVGFQNPYQAIAACGRMQVQIRRSHDQLILEFPSEDLALLYGASPSGLKMLLMGCLAKQTNDAHMDDSSPGFALIKSHFTENRLNLPATVPQARNYGPYAIALSLVLLPLIVIGSMYWGLVQLKQQAEDQIEEVKKSVQSISDSVAEQGRKLEGVVHASEDLVEWIDVKGRLNQLLEKTEAE